LGPDFVVQSSASTHRVVTALRSWLKGEGPPHLIVTGPAGCGLSYLADVSREALGLKAVYLSSKQETWALPSTLGPDIGLVVDDLDGFDKKFLSVVFEEVRGKAVRVLGTAHKCDARSKSKWTAELGAPAFVELAGVAARSEDLASYISMRVRDRALPCMPEDPRYTGTVGLVLELLEAGEGFSQVDLALAALVEDGSAPWDPPNAVSWVRAVKAARRPVKRDAIVLVEGKTDVIYLEWILALAGVSSPDLVVLDCKSAGNVVTEAVRCRNEGWRAIVALLDLDKMGLEAEKDLKKWGHRAIVLPRTAFPFGAESDHLKVAVEIEDLLPVEVIERFQREHPSAVPELVISAPRNGAIKIVVHPDDKLALARWVAEQCGAEASQAILAVMNELRRELGLRALAIPKPSTGMRE